MSDIESAKNCVNLRNDARRIKEVAKRIGELSGEGPA
jgi:hypothetical protein